jgi:hypothetical protein
MKQLGAVFIMLVCLLPGSAFAAWGTGGGTCTAQSKAADTSLACTVATEDMNAGNVIFLWFGGDNVSTTDSNSQLLSSVTDSKSNTWLVDHCYTNGNGSAGTGSTACLAHSVLTTTLTSGVDTITANYSSITAKAFVTKEYTIAGGSTVYASWTGSTQDLANDAADPGSIAMAGMPSAEHLWVRVTALERASGGTWTVSTNFTTAGCNGTTGSTADTNIEACGEYRIVSATSQTSDPTGTAVDNASVYIPFTEATMPTGFVQECHNGSGSLGTTMTCAMPSAVTATNLIACYTHDQSTTDTVTVTDTLSNTWTNQSTYYADATNTRRAIGVYSKNITGGYTVITSTWSASTSQRGLSCHEISGMDTTDPTDGYVGQNQQNPGTGSDAVTSTAATTAGASGYLFGATYVTDGSCTNTTAGTGWTGVVLTGCQWPLTEARASSAAGSYAALFTGVVSTSDYTTLIQAFKVTATGILMQGGVGGLVGGIH